MTLLSYCSNKKAHTSKMNVSIFRKTKAENIFLMKSAEEFLKVTLYQMIEHKRKHITLTSQYSRQL